jgi:hypothetical protein
MPTLSGAQWELDTPVAVRLNSNEYYISGWFLPAPAKQPSQRLLVEVDGVLDPVTTGMRRNDVAEYFGSHDFANCGLTARFRKPALRSCVRLVLADADRHIDLAQATIPGTSTSPG